MRRHIGLFECRAEAIEEDSMKAGGQDTGWGNYIRTRIREDSLRRPAQKRCANGTASAWSLAFVIPYSLNDSHGSKRPRVSLSVESCCVSNWSIWLIPLLKVTGFHCTE
jgi:hypothetical protein